MNLSFELHGEEELSFYSQDYCPRAFTEAEAWESIKPSLFSRVGGSKGV